MSQILWWEPVCGNRSEQDAFWSDSITVNTTNPDFTLCFQTTVLVWGPCGLLWLCAPFYLLSLASRPTVHPCGQISRLNLAKTIIGVLLIIVTAIDLIKAISEQTDGDNDVPIAPLISAIISLATMALATTFITYEFRKGEHSGGILFIFWLMLLVIGLVPFRSKIIHAQDEGEVEDVFRAVTFYVYYALVLVQFVLQICADTEAIEPYKDERRRGERQPLLQGEPAKRTAKPGIPCPESRASFLSRLLWWWITKMIVQGYSRAVEFKDLWDLNPEDTCKGVVPPFEKEWAKELSGGLAPRGSEQYDHHMANSGKYAKIKEVETAPSKKKKVPTATLR